MESVSLRLIGYSTAWITANVNSIAEIWERAAIYLTLEDTRTEKDDGKRPVRATKWIRGLKVRVAKEGAHIDCTEEAGGIPGALKWWPEVFPSRAVEEEVRACLLRGTTSVTSWGGGEAAAIAVRIEGQKVGVEL
jgi:hypothetical protein